MKQIIFILVPFSVFQGIICPPTGPRAVKNAFKLACHKKSNLNEIDRTQEIPTRIECNMLVKRIKKLQNRINWLRQCNFYVLQPKRFTEETTVLLNLGKQLINYRALRITNNETSITQLLDSIQKFCKHNCSNESVSYSLGFLFKKVIIQINEDAKKLQDSTAHKALITRIEKDLTKIYPK